MFTGEQKKEYSRQYYLRNKEKMRETARKSYERRKGEPAFNESMAKCRRAWQVRRKQQVQDEKMGGCVDCGITEMVVLQFHHLVPALKKFSINKGMWKYKWETIMAEIDKCVVLCANCHTRRHCYGTQKAKGVACKANV